MSSTTTRLYPAYRVFPLTATNVFWAKLAVQIAFGCLFLLDSFFFVLSYATFDFFGARNSPFFSWLRQLSFIMQMLYFPALCAALLCIEMGRERERARRLAFFFVIAQLAAGAVLVLVQSKAGLYGCALLFGPVVQKLLGSVDPYIQAVAGLIPLAWISAIHIRTSFRATGSQAISNTMRLSSFLMAALAVSLLYLGAARMRLASSDQPFTLPALSFSVASHLAVFALIFVVLQWIRLAASRSSNPGLVQFALRAVVAWILMAILVRKIVFALLSFNDYLANLYAAIFSLTFVVFIAGLVLKIKEQRALMEAAREPVARGPASWTGAAWAGASCALVAAVGLFYIFAIKFAAVDWEHILSCVAALLISSCILWFFLAVRRPVRNCGTIFLLLLSLVTLGALAGLQRIALRERLAGELEQYSDYDPSFFAIQQALKPAVQDEEYAAWYKFLALHANIRQPVQAPEMPLTEQLKRTEIKRPNIFVFIIDALRRDYVSAYNPAVTFTPAFSAFAQESVIFDAYSGYAGTELAVPAILSGIQQLNKTFPEPVRRLNHLQDMVNVDGYDCYTSYNPIVASLADKSDHITNLSADLETDDQQEFHHIIRKLEDAILRRTDRNRPIFVYSQPANVHTLYLNWHRGQVDVKPHPGFDDAYASAVEQVDASFREFVAFLKKEGLYENSIVIVTADHGESLGEMGRHGHVNYLTPEVIQIPLMIHLPDRNKSELAWDAKRLASLHDITPTLYYLLGHRSLNRGEMVGRSLFYAPGTEQAPQQPDHYFLMSSYMPVFGVLSGDQRSLFFVDAVLDRSFYYDLQHDPHAFKKRMTVPIRDRYDAVIRQDLKAIDRFYGLTEERLGQAAP
jgi:glucan phosphoethanolaminetransferase (alkaline phosphatase superfamily)